MKKLINFPKLIKTLWICLWAILGILLILKFCFGKWYPIVVNNEFIIKICEFVDCHRIIECLIGGILYVFSINVWILSAIKRYKYDNIIIFIIINIFVIGTYLIKFYLNITLANIIELGYLIIFPIIFNLIKHNLRNKWFNIFLPIVVYILINLFQLNILLIRNINEILTNMPSLIYLTMQIDYYIFLIIMWLGVNNMGWLTGGWFFGKSLTELKAEREKELAKEEPDKDFIAELDKAIAEKEAKGE